MFSKDKTLCYLSSSVLNRNLPKIIIGKEKLEDSFINDIRKNIMSDIDIPESEIGYYLYKGEISNNAYSNIDERINILYGNKLIDISDASDLLNLSVLSKVVKKYYVCAPKNMFNKIY
jgi:hypothetical protein